MPYSNHTQQPKVDSNLREHLSFNAASEGTIQRTNLAKSFLEDYYKHIPTRPEKTEEPPKEKEKEKEKEIEDDTKVKVKSKNKSKDKEKDKDKASKKKPEQKAHDSPQITRPFSVLHHAHVEFVKGSGLQVQNLPNDLQEFVEELNTTLVQLGADSITEDELKLVLSSAKLPTSSSAPSLSSTYYSNTQPPLPRNEDEVVNINDKIDSNMNSIIDSLTPPSSPPTTNTNNTTQNKLKRSESVKVAPSHPPPPYPSYDNHPSLASSASSPSINMNVVVGSDKKDKKDKDKKDKKDKPKESEDKEKAKEKEKEKEKEEVVERVKSSRTRKLTQFFTNRGSPNRLSRSFSESSKSNLEAEKSHLSKSESVAAFERAQPRGAKTSNFEISGPRNFAKVGGFDSMSVFGGDNTNAMKIKLELADKALQNENQLRLAAEEKTATLEKQVTELKIELEQAQNQTTTLTQLLEEEKRKAPAQSNWRKQADSEIAMLRRKVAIKIKSEEDLIAANSKKQRQLEVQIAELKSQLAETKTNNTTTNREKENTTKLVDDVKTQLAQAEAEVQTVKAQLHSERNQAQEENETLRKELEALKTSFEQERNIWLSLRFKLESDVDNAKAETQRKMEEATKRLEEERKKHKVDQMMYETLLNNNNNNNNNNNSLNASSSSISSSSSTPSPSPLLSSIPSTPPRSILIDSNNLPHSPILHSPPPPPILEMDEENGIENGKLNGTPPKAATNKWPVANEDKIKDEERPGTPEAKRLDILAKAIIARRKILEDKPKDGEGEVAENQNGHEKEREQKEKEQEIIPNGHVSKLSE